MNDITKEARVIAQKALKKAKQTEETTQKPVDVFIYDEESLETISIIKRSFYEFQGNSAVATFQAIEQVVSYFKNVITELEDKVTSLEQQISTIDTKLTQHTHEYDDTKINDTEDGTGVETTTLLNTSTPIFT